MNAQILCLDKILSSPGAFYKPDEFGKEEPFKEATLDASVGMRMFNNNKEMTVRIAECIKDGMIMDDKSIEMQLLQIRRTRVSPLVEKVLSAFLAGDLLLLYVKTARVPPALPFVTLKHKTGHIKSYVFLNNFASLRQDQLSGANLLDIDYKDLYALMESAYVAYKYYEYPAVLKRNSGIMKSCTLIYANMMLRVLNKDFGLSTNRDAYDQVTYVLSKFFLESVWEANNPQLVSTYASAAILTPDRGTLSILANDYDVFLGKDPIRSFPDMLNFLNAKFPRLSKLNLKVFIQSYMNYYTANALFGIDVLPYFLFMVLSTLLGSYKLVNQAILLDIIKNTSNIKPGAFYAELAKII